MGAFWAPGTDAEPAVTAGGAAQITRRLFAVDIFVQEGFESVRRRFRIWVDGREYEVEVEELSSSAERAEKGPARPAGDGGKGEPYGGAGAVPGGGKPAAGLAADRAGQRGEGGGQPETGFVAGTVTVVAPLPGIILDIKVAVGQHVEEGDVLCVLEAMKMENEITAPATGTVTHIHVAKGAAVNLGDVLMVIS